MNWVQYHPIGNGPAATLLATLGRFLAYFVVLFPAMDVISVYPLNVMVSLSPQSLQQLSSDMMYSAVFFYFPMCCLPTVDGNCGVPFRDYNIGMDCMW